MRKSHKLISALAVLIFLLGVGLFIYLIAQTGFHRDRVSGRQGGGNFIEKIDFRPASNTTYKTTCEGCHFPYPPELLPGASWKIIINRLPDHFREEVSIDLKSQEVISKYLMENGADRSLSKKSIKIMKSLNGQIPLRITEIPYIQKKHRKIKSEIFGRKSIGSLSNCIACHKTAEQGNFDEDFVTIPD
jgi:hypothetical protein